MLNQHDDAVVVNTINNIGEISSAVNINSSAPPPPPLPFVKSLTLKTVRVPIDRPPNAPSIPTYLIRHKDGVSAYCGVEEDIPHFNLVDEILDCLWSPDGTQIVTNSSTDGLVVYTHPVWKRNISKEPNSITSTTANKIILKPFPNSPLFSPRSLRHIQWSPKGSYVVAFWQYISSKVSSGLDERNVFVWSTAFADDIEVIRPIAGFTLKAVTTGQWPILNWRNDEIYCCLSIGSALLVYGDIKGQPLLKIPIPGIVCTEIAPIPENNDEIMTLAFATFSPSLRLGAESSIFRIIEITVPQSKVGELEKGNDDCGGSSGDLSWNVCLERPLGFTDSAEISWNTSGTTVLVLASSIADSSGANYGSVGDAYLAKRDGTLTVKLNEKEAQDISWSPTEDLFVLIEGKSPSDIYLYDGSCKLQTKFPSAYRNTIRWDSSGHLLAIGGFGNLAGDLSFWYNEKPEPLLIAEWREPCVVLCDWSPDCEYFSTASTYPRMKVDNQYCIFNRRGDLILCREKELLFSFQWQPQPKNCNRCITRPIPQKIISLNKEKFRRFEKERSDDERRKRKQKDNYITTNPSAPKTTALLSANKDERSRQLDSISDWRCGTKLVPMAGNKAEPTPTTTTTTTQRRRSLSKSNSTKKLHEDLTSPEIVEDNSNGNTQVDRIDSRLKALALFGTRSSSSSSNSTPSASSPANSTMKSLFAASLGEVDEKKKYANAAVAGLDEKSITGSPQISSINNSSNDDSLLGLLKSILPPESRVRMTPPESSQQSTQARNSICDYNNTSSTNNSNSITGLIDSIIARARQPPPPQQQHSAAVIGQIFSSSDRVNNIPPSTATTDQYPLLSQRFGKINPRCSPQQSELLPFLERLRTANEIVSPPISQILRNNNSNNNAAAAASYRLFSEDSRSPIFSKFTENSTTEEHRRQEEMYQNRRHHHDPNRVTTDNHHSSPRPNPMRDPCWQYLDLAGVIRGPFKAQEMRTWYCNGYLKLSLPVRCCVDDPFVALGQLYLSQEPFLESPNL